MDVIAADAPVTPTRVHSGKATIATASVLSAAAFLWMRAGTSLPTQFQGMCERLHEAGLAVTPRDVFCLPVPWTSRAAYLAAALLIAAGFVLPCVILAFSGHRLLAFLPLLAAPAVSYPQGLMFSARWWGSITWPHGGVISTSATMLVLAFPVAAVVYVKRTHRVPRPGPSLIPGIVATIACGAVVVVVVFLARGIVARHFGGQSGGFDIEYLVPPTLAIAVFGALLGPDRRWWPWSLAPIAVLLSAGPSYALIIGPERVFDWSNFAVVVPLFAAGLVGSAWGLIATSVARSVPDPDAPIEADSASTDGDPRPDARRVRPAVVLNAFAVGLLAVSLIVFRADPMPAHSAGSLPTYLGARISIENLRTKMDLREAMTAMDTYRAAQGTYRGFDAARGTASDASIGWTDGLPTPASDGEYGGSIGIVSANRREARVVARSASGTVFCLQRSGADLSYGSAVQGSVPGREGLFEQAVSVCGSRPWSANAVRRFRFETMCDDVEPDGYLICRAVQILMTKTMQGSKAA